MEQASDKLWSCSLETNGEPTDPANVNGDLYKRRCCLEAEDEEALCIVEAGSSTFDCAQGCAEEGLSYWAETGEEFEGYPEAACAE